MGNGVHVYIFLKPFLYTQYSCGPGEGAMMGSCINMVDFIKYYLHEGLGTHGYLFVLGS